MGVKYKAGGFAVPGSTGDLAVTGLGFRPQGVVFFGSNQATEDSVVTAANAGAFWGLMADNGSGTLLAHANAVIPTKGQRSSGTQPILMTSTFNAIEYAASPVSLDANGFTVNFSTVAANRWVHYLAWGGSENVFAERVTDAAVTTSIGFQAMLMLLAGDISSGGGNAGDWIRGDLPGYTFAWQGGAAYPDLSNWENAQLSTVRSPGTGQIATRLTGVQGTQPADPVVAFGAGFIGPFLTEPLHYAYPASTTQVYESTAGGLTNSDLFAWWEGPGDAGSGVPNGTLDGITSQSLSNMTEAEAILFFGAAGWETGPGVGSSGQALMFGVKTADYEGCVMVNQSGNYLFQSQQRAWCARATASGALAGTIDLNTDGTFDFHTQEDDVSSATVAWVAFGPTGAFLPQIYRLVLPGGVGG